MAPARKQSRHSNGTVIALVKGQGQRESLDRAVEELGLAEERPFHRALDDAYYTGRVMGAMDFYSMVEYV